MDILLVILGIIIFGALTFALFAGQAVRQNSIPRDDGQEIYDPQGIDDGMALIVYQPSERGKIDEYTHMIAQELYKRGYKVVMDRPSIDLSNNVAEYDIIILGSNVYVGQMSGLILDYVTSLPSLKHKTLGLFSNGRLENNSEFSEIEASIKGKPRIVTTKFVSSDIATPAERVKDFVSELIG